MNKMSIAVWKNVILKKEKNGVKCKKMQIKNDAKMRWNELLCSGDAVEWEQRCENE